jgi:hypothetical protein
MASGAKQGMHLGDTTTKQAPSDLSESVVIVQGEPLRFGREGASGVGVTVVKCEDDDVPECIAIERCAIANHPIGVRLIPNAVAASANAAAFIDELVYTGAVPAGDDLGVLANGAGAWKIVAAGGIGKVISAAGGLAIVQF